MQQLTYIGEDSEWDSGSSDSKTIDKRYLLKLKDFSTAKKTVQ